MTPLDVRAEVERIARLLDIEPERVTYLESAPAADLRKLRNQLSDILYDGDSASLRRVAAGAKFLPAPLAASIGQHVFGALLCARVAGVLEVGRAVELAQRVPPEFLAEIARHMDPRRANVVIGRLPTDRVVHAAAALAKRRDFVAMAAFVEHLSDDAILAAAPLLDDETLLRIAFYVESRKRLEELLTLLGDERVAGMVRAAHEHSLWPDALELVGNLGPKRRRHIAALAAAESDEVLSGIARAATEHGLFERLLPLVAAMGEDELRRFAKLSAVQAKATLTGIVRAAAAQEDLWPALVPLVPSLPAKAQRHVEAVAAEIGPEHAARLREGSDPLEGGRCARGQVREGSDPLEGG